MFRKMRRFRQQISFEECQEILKRASSGVLGLFGDDGYPYTTGHKIDAIRRNEKVSFTVIDRDEIMPKERTTKFCSVIVFGRARILETEEELRRSANAVGAKYSAGFEDLYMQETEDTIRSGSLCCVEITIDHMTGKIGRQILMEREQNEQKNQITEDQ